MHADPEAVSMPTVSWIPNTLSWLRIILAASLLPVALTGHPHLFLGVLGCAFVSDAMDGFLARRLEASTELGRRLDSWGDYVLVATVLPGLVILWPDVMRREALWFFVAIVAYFLPMAWSLIRWHALPGFHTWAAKALAVAMAIALPVMLLGGPPQPVRVICALQVIAALEEFAIIRLLPGWSGSIPTLIHARRMARS